ncbi:hypothetical protein PEL8287_01516 [Roseovarius litorisediminis]|uniref:Uncharacterized protein n=1 Tax=Roseovarius litorisediminis TaxID=1312363 RepID=A0A1Y5S5Q0_9RHOB|nr:hypothetical protein [Roseovarius litorisediminis]SLN32246.1 hypothetical protein PEL8287_01516 [Roseovarius litorisediminis]
MVTTALKIAGFTLLLATPLAAQDKTFLCNTSGEIVGAAVTLRVSGASNAATIKSISKSLEGDKATFKPAVQPIVDWVYTLDEPLLTDEVAPAYVEACLAQ